MTPALLSSIRAHPHLPPNTWYYVAATTLSVLNRPEEVPKVYEHALRSEAGSGSGSCSEKTLGDEEQLSISRRTREALIKASAVGGLPKVCTKADFKDRNCLTVLLADHQFPHVFEGGHASSLAR